MTDMTPEQQALRASYLHCDAMLDLTLKASAVNASFTARTWQDGPDFAKQLLPLQPQSERTDQ